MNKLILVFAGILIYSIATNIHAINVNADSCLESDIQSAIDNVKSQGGGTVIIPEGECSHSKSIKMPDGISLIGKGQGKTIISDFDIRVSTRFYGNLDKGLRISGMSLPGNSHLRLDSVHDFRVDHLTIEAESGGFVIDVSDSSSGVIDHCIINGNSSLYGISVKHYKVGEDDWESDISNMLGKPTAIFIEDNIISGCGHAIVGHGHAHYVARFNHFEKSTQHDVDMHGPGYGAPAGARLSEIYNNTFSDSPYKWKAIGIRGGSAMIFNNTFNDYNNAIGLHLESRAGITPENMRVNGIWIWNNKYNNLGAGSDGGRCPGNFLEKNDNCNKVFVWDIGRHPGLYSQDEIVKDRDYFLRSPSRGQDGFEYTPYIYPHPMAGERESRLDYDAGAGSAGSVNLLVYVALIIARRITRTREQTDRT